MTWKNYSTQHCGQTVTDMMIGFAAFGSLHQGQDKLRNILIANVTWKNKVKDLEKLLHRGLWPNGDRYYYWVYCVKATGFLNDI